MHLRDFGTQSCFYSFISDLTYLMTQMMLRLLYMHMSTQITQIILCHWIIGFQHPLRYLFTNTFKKSAQNTTK